MVYSDDKAVIKICNDRKDWGFYIDVIIKNSLRKTEKILETV